MKIVTIFLIIFALSVISCDTGNPEIARNTSNQNLAKNGPDQISAATPPIIKADPNGPSPTQILKKAVAAYGANPVLSGSVKFEEWHVNDYDNGSTREVSEYRFVYNKEGDKALDLTLDGDKRFTQRVSVKDNFALSDYNKRTEFDDVDAGMKAFQETSKSQFLLGQILFQDEATFFKKMGLVFEPDERVNETDCFVISVVPASGLKRKVWITKDRFLISKYYMESCSESGVSNGSNCLYAVEEYDYRS